MKRFLLVVFCFMFVWTSINSAQKNSPKPQVKVVKAWARPAAEHTNSALYFIIENRSAKTDTLLGAESKAADIVQVHETFKRDNDRMGMRELPYVVIPPRSNVAFKPGAMHVMLIDTQMDLKIGTSINATLKFKYSGKIKIRARVQDIAGAE